MTVANHAYSFAAEPQLDHVWITEPEWKAMIPAKAEIGFTFEMPKPVAERFAVFHMLDKGLGCNGHFWEKATARMSLKVIEATNERIKMALSGKGLIGKAGSEPVIFQGWIEVDRAKGEISRFDMVALGRDNVDLRTAENEKSVSNYWYRVGPKATVMMAIAFEKIAGDKPIDRVPPYAIMFNSAKAYNRPYFK